MSYTRMCGEIKKASQAICPNMQYEYIWVIKNLPQYYKVSGFEYAHASPSFTIGLNNEYEWTLDMYVAGYDRENSDYIGICPYLYETEKHKDAKFAIEISLLDKDCEMRLTRKATLTHENINQSDGMFKDFVLRRDLWNKSELLPDDVLTFVCKIRIGEPSIISDEDNALKRSYENSHSTLEKLWQCRQFSDFKLIVEKKEFCVHRGILAVASPVFQAMFESDMREASEGKVLIQDVEANVMEKTLHFIYVGKLDDADDLVDKIIAVAEKYQLDSLKQLCESVLVKQLNVENVYKTLLLADLNNAGTLKNQAIQFFLKNAKKLYTTASDFKTSIEMLPVNLQTQIICTFVANL